MFPVVLASSFAFNRFCREPRSVSHRISCVLTDSPVLSQILAVFLRNVPEPLSFSRFRAEPHSPVFLQKNLSEPRPESTEPRPESTEPRPESTEPRPDLQRPRLEIPQSLPRPDPSEPRPDPSEPRPDPSEPRPDPSEIERGRKSSFASPGSHRASIGSHRASTGSLRCSLIFQPRLHCFPQGSCVLTDPPVFSQILLCSRSVPPKPLGFDLK